MQKIYIEGIATISEKGFHFDSGMPSNEPVLDAPKNIHGTLKISKNACADIVDNARVILPPEMNKVAQGEGYHIKRTSRNYLIQLKVPIVEKRAVTEKTLKDLVPVVMGELTLDRKELIG